jgi:DNA (cytosine-5)-methyltransferase 1
MLLEIGQTELGFAVKGGTSSQKSDILLDISNHQINKQNEGFSIKSYLGKTYFY